MTIDSFYTSPELADTLVSFANITDRPRLVADFSCGEGSLLLAAERRWPGVPMLANDVSRTAVRKLRAIRPGWKFSSANFLNQQSIRSSHIRDCLGLVDLIVLNPPFSRRNRKTHSVQLDGAEYRVSVATAFVVNSVPLLSQNGSLLAVLPDGCLVSTSDEPVWRKLKNIFKFEIIRDNSRSAFHGVSARTSLIRMSKNNNIETRIATKKTESRPLVQIERGSCQMHTRNKIRPGSYATLVHTTHLKNGKVADSGELVIGKVVPGPALLFPRVGRITPDKVCLLANRQRVVLSDCVMAVRCGSHSEGVELRARIIAEWSSFAASFRGTGAPYITVNRAAHVLTQIINRRETECLRNSIKC